MHGDAPCGKFDVCAPPGTPPLPPPPPHTLTRIFVRLHLAVQVTLLRNKAATRPSEDERHKLSNKDAKRSVRTLASALRLTPPTAASLARIAASGQVPEGMTHVNVKPPKRMYVCPQGCWSSDVCGWVGGGGGLVYLGWKGGPGWRLALLCHLTQRPSGLVSLCVGVGVCVLPGAANPSKPSLGPSRLLLGLSPLTLRGPPPVTPWGF